MIYLISIVLIIVIILFLIKLLFVYSNNEHYSGVKNKFNSISEDILNLSKKNQYQEVLKSIDDSVTDIEDYNITKLKSRLIDDNLLNSHLENMLFFTDNNQANPIFQESNVNNLLPEKKNDGNINDIRNYNHKTNLINNSKKLYQDYLIDSLKLKINKLLNSIKDVNELKM